MQTPLTGLAMMLGFAAGVFGVMIPLIAATVSATAVTR